MERENLKKYLAQNDIYVMDNNFYFNKDEYTLEEIKKHIIIINAIHKILMKFYSYENIGVKSTIGKNIEKLKLDIKRLRRSIINIEIKNSMDEFIFLNGNSILNQAEDAISRLKKINYIDLIRRAMKKNEICLGKVDETNIRVMDRIEIGTINEISYNLVEDDICNYIRKLKKSSYEDNFNEVVDWYIKVAKLNNTSKDYINTMLLIPIDSIKVWKKYLKNKKNYESSYYLKKISNSYKNEILIIMGEEEYE